MKYPLISLLAHLLFISACAAQPAWTDKTRVLPDELRKVPVSILLTHTPNPNYPELNTENVDKGKYVWKHSTSVSAINKSLQVIKAGSYIWYSEAGWQRNVEYNKREFIDRFNCPGGRLIAGETYTFSKNYRYGQSTYGGDALWYVIAKDADGLLYKGISIIETEAEVIN